MAVYVEADRHAEDAVGVVSLWRDRLTTIGSRHKTENT